MNWSEIPSHDDFYFLTIVQLRHKEMTRAKRNGHHGKTNGAAKKPPQSQPAQPADDVEVTFLHGGLMFVCAC